MQAATPERVTPPPPASLAVRVLVLLIVGVAAAVRLAALDRIPPGLWYDEAIYALDGLEAATDGPRIFYTTENHMREPLYIWSLGGFFSLFGFSVAKARLVSALWGILTVAVLWPVARRMFWDLPRMASPSSQEGPREGSGPAAWRASLPGPDLWALAAVLSFAVFRWHIHFSRTIFRALLPSLFFLLGVWLFRRWRERRRGGDAVLAGAVLGAGMYTYLSFRLAPLLFGIWAAWLLWRGYLRWREDWRQLSLLVGTWMLVFLPLAADWVRHPEHFSGRTEEVSMFTKKVSVPGPNGSSSERILPKTPGEALVDLAGNARQVAGMWTFRGDHVGKHNLPYEPVFDLANGLVFYAGLVWCVLRVVRVEWAFLLLAWIGVLSLTSVFSFGAPNILRMQGMTPAVILVYVAGLRWMSAGLTARRLPGWIAPVATACLLLLLGAQQLNTYFRTFPYDLQVEQEFQLRTFVQPAQAVRDWARSHEALPPAEGASGGVRPGIVYVPELMAHHPSFRFITAGLRNVRPYGPGAPLPLHGPRPFAVLTVDPALAQALQAGNDHLAQLHSIPGVRQIRSIPAYFNTPRNGMRGMRWATLWEIPREQGAATGQ